MKENKNNAIENFVDKILKEKNLAVQDPEVLAELTKDLVDRVEMHINATLLEKMPQEKLEDFNKIVEAGNESEIQEFCKQNIINLDEVVANALLRFRQTYLGSNK